MVLLCVPRQAQDDSQQHRAAMHWVISRNRAIAELVANDLAARWSATVDVGRGKLPAAAISPGAANYALKSAPHLRAAHVKGAVARKAGQGGMRSGASGWQR
jgi:hypothetical protein